MVALAVCDDTLITAAATGRFVQANLRAMVGAAASSTPSPLFGGPLYTASLHGALHDASADSLGGSGGALSGVGGAGGASLAVDGGPVAAGTVGVPAAHHANHMRVETERIRSAKGLKEKGPIAGLALLPESRLIAVGYEDGFVRLCF